LLNAVNPAGPVKDLLRDREQSFTYTRKPILTIPEDSSDIL